eukprot:1963204-Heterocapsa_arctica.AAC.1
MDEANAETQEYGEQQKGNCLATKSHTGIFPSEEVNQQEITENMREIKHNKRSLNKQEDGEYPG